MFDLPDAKRIRRSDLLRSRSSSQSSDTSQTEANATLLQAKLAAIYGPIEYDEPSPTQISIEKGSSSQVEGSIESEGRGGKRRRIETAQEEGRISSPFSESQEDSEDEEDVTERRRVRSPTPEEHEYEFSLFRTHSSHPSSASQIQQPQTIILSSSPGPGEGRILRSRPISHYIVDTADGAKRAQWEYAAVSGEDVLRGQERRAWGLEVRWRVRVLKNGELVVPSRDYFSESFASLKPMSGFRGDQDQSSEKKKVKPNKKRRIILRVQARKRELAEESRKKAEEMERKTREEKEEAAKEKKIRLNREKKMKRKLKEKARKAEAGGGAVVEENGTQDPAGNDGGSTGDTD
ncbi:hypothetical protein WAI453_004895 [Rhynchosporium graminicola]|uniref:Uncharacterized protein n=1 Tax=Rhynchosporium graminicola TaxID=2792576 RepID=A0A1E1L539_9HELO|nr:uncharacterized protein RCO7_10396 [Rhynchosporium commune]